MPTQEQIDARKALHELEKDAKHNPPPGGDPAADAQTRDDDVSDPKHQAKDRKQDDRWVEIPGGGGWSHPDHDQ